MEITTANGIEQIAEDIVMVKNHIYENLQGHSLTACTLADAIAEYYPDIQRDELTDICRKLYTGVRIGRHRGNQIAALTAEQQDEYIPAMIDELIKEKTQEEQRQQLLTIYHMLLISGNIEVTPEIGVMLTNMSKERLKQDIAFIVREQGQVSADKLLYIVKNLRVLSESSDNNRYTEEENDWIYAAALCACHKMELKKIDTQYVGENIGMACSYASALKDAVLGKALPVVLGAVAAIATGFAIFSIFTAAMAVPPVAAVVTTVCGTAPFVPAIGFGYALGICFAAGQIVYQAASIIAQALTARRRNTQRAANALDMHFNYIEKLSQNVIDQIPSITESNVLNQTWVEEIDMDLSDTEVIEEEMPVHI